MTQETKEWYERAVMDFGVAKHLEETYYPKPIEIICYHCQQSAEKAIKALIMHYGAEGGMPKLHDSGWIVRWKYVTPDWLLIYRVNDGELYLVRTGTHADLFGL